MDLIDSQRTGWVHLQSITRRWVHLQSITRNAYIAA
jgi:hypothetical protein